jgi:hypothetical protein
MSAMACAVSDAPLVEVLPQLLLRGGLDQTGPVVVNYIREAQLAAGVPRDHLYDYTMYILCGMLVIGLICNARSSRWPRSGT